MSRTHWRARLAEWPVAARQRLVLAMLLVAALLAWLAGPISHSTYLAFADVRDCLGVPNYANVVSNLGFLVVGLYGLWCLRPAGIRPRGGLPGDLPSNAASRFPAFQYPFEITVYRTLFAGVLLTAFGSAYFHWAPDVDGLFWDRLPMTIVLMTLLCATFAERVDPEFGRRWFLPLLIIGPAAALHWRLSVATGSEDLRLYGLAQYLTLLIVVVLHAFRSRYAGRPWVLIGIGIYAVAKVFEMLDRDLLWMTAGAISGHSAKHLVAALALYCIVLQLRGRSLRSAPPHPPG